MFYTSNLFCSLYHDTGKSYNKLFNLNAVACTYYLNCFFSCSLQWLWQVGRFFDVSAACTAACTARTLSSAYVPSASPVTHSATCTLTKFQNSASFFKESRPAIAYLSRNNTADNLKRSTSPKTFIAKAKSAKFWSDVRQLSGNREFHNYIYT